MSETQSAMPQEGRSVRAAGRQFGASASGAASGAAMAAAPERPAGGPGGEAGPFSRLQVRLLTASTLGILMLMVTGTLYFGRDFFLPIVMAVLFGLVLRPIVRWLARRRVPPAISAVVLVLCLVMGLAVGVYYLSGPVAEWIDNAPRIGQELKLKLAELRESVEAVKRASEEVEKAASGTDDPAVQQVVVKEPGLLSRMATGLPDVVAEAVLCFVLLLFLLASGELFLEKMIRTLPTMRDKVQMLRIARDVESEISHYLMTVTAINFCLGCAIAAGMAAIGMPNPYLWGLAAAILNFLPYLGSIAGIVIVTAVAIVSYDSLANAALAPAIYLALTTLEGQFITPLILGRRLRLNPIAIFVAVAFWAFLWGIAGAFIAVPLLIIAKVVSDHSRTLAPLAEFLSGRHLPAEGEQRQ